MDDKLQKAKEFLGKKWLVHPESQVKRLPADKIVIPFLLKHRG